jgi:hypothetical protein
MADWYQKTQKFQRAVYAGDGSLEDKSTLSSPSWQSRTNSFRAAQLSTPTQSASRNTPTFPSGWA